MKYAGINEMDFNCSDTKVLSRKPLVYPVRSVLAEKTADALILAQEQLWSVQDKPWPVSPESVLMALATESKCRRFQHPLCDHYAVNNTIDALSNRTPTEQQYVEVFSLALKQSLSSISYANIRGVLESAARALTGHPVCIRTTRTRVKCDRRGRSVAFVEPKDIPASLIVLWQYMADLPVGRRDVWGASVAALGLMNCHPFADGNGRLARMLFNALVGCTSDNYIPLYDFYNCTPGGHVLRIRQAELFGEWDDWINFHCDIIGFMCGH
jgi:hypothetical protein